MLSVTGNSHEFINWFSFKSPMKIALYINYLKIKTSILSLNTVFQQQTNTKKKVKHLMVCNILYRCIFHHSCAILPTSQQYSSRESQNSWYPCQDSLAMESTVSCSVSAATSYSMYGQRLCDFPPLSPIFPRNLSSCRLQPIWCSS